MKSEEWAEKFNRMPVTGDCDAGCGKPATTWFGLTSCATCGDSACVNVLQDSYDREGEKPAFGPVGRGADDPLYDALAKIAGLEEWVDNLQLENAALNLKLAALYTPPSQPDLEQRIADWHEGRAGAGQELHEYLGMTWAEYADWLKPRLPRPPTRLALVLEKVDDICERFELEGLHSHPTYKQFKRLFAELDALKNSSAHKDPRDAQ